MRFMKTFLVTGNFGGKIQNFFVCAGEQREGEGEGRGDESSSSTSRERGSGYMVFVI